MLSNGLAFAAKETSIQNNLSVVLLIEWKKRRLLFVGDAEWEGEFKEGKHNGSWNVMWEKHRKTHLKAPLDFLKIGHHGSINATPPPAGDQRRRGRRPTAVFTDAGHDPAGPEEGEADRPGDRLDRTGVLQPDSGVQAAGRPRPAREQHALLRRRLKKKKIDPKGSGRRRRRRRTSSSRSTRRSSSISRSRCAPIWSS